MSGNNGFEAIGHGVPIVGQQVKCLVMRPMVVAQCNCGKPDAQVFTLMDPQEVAVCLGCGGHYIISKFTVTNDNGNITGGCTITRVRAR